MLTHREPARLPISPRICVGVVKHKFRSAPAFTFCWALLPLLCTLIQLPSQSTICGQLGTCPVLPTCVYGLLVIQGCVESSSCLPMCVSFPGTVLRFWLAYQSAVWPTGTAIKTTRTTLFSCHWDHYFYWQCQWAWASHLPPIKWASSGSQAASFDGRPHPETRTTLMWWEGEWSLARTANSHSFYLKFSSFLW